MTGKMKIILLAIILLFFATPFASASLSTSTFTYRVGDSSLSASIDSSTNRCLSSNGNSSIGVIVKALPSGAGDVNAVVTATILKPDSNSVSVSFTNLLDGNYSNTFNYDKNGTYRIDITILDNNNNLGSATLTDYIYAVDFDINVSFQNNNASYSAGDTGTIRNYVTNKDGNFFNDLNGTTTIYYPGASIFANNQAMSSQGSGQYIYTFIVPSTTGTYSASSTFSCSTKSDTNTAGQFTVPGGGGGGGNNNNGGGGTSGGGGGGGGGGGISVIEARISDILLNPLRTLIPTPVEVVVANTGISTFDGQVKVTITQEGVEEYKEASDFITIKGHQTVTFQLQKFWKPLSAGSHVVIAELISSDGRVIDKKQKEIVMLGRRDYSLNAVCRDPTKTFDVPVDFNIVVENRGDYIEDLTAAWEITNKFGEKVFSGNFPVISKPGEKVNLILQKTIATGNPPGIYEFSTKLKFDGTFAEDSCTFMIEEPCTYYSKLIQGVNEDINSMETELKNKGPDAQVLSFITGRLTELKKKVNSVQSEIGSNVCTGHDQELNDIYKELTELKALMAGVSERAFLRTQALANILLALALLTIIIALFYNSTRKEYYLEITKQEQKLDEMIGLKMDAKKLKDKVKKNSEINILLGLPHEAGKKNFGKGKK